jgi:RND family efflux transporter MFP subunit
MSRLAIISGLLLIAVAGCNKKGPAEKGNEVPVVPVSNPVKDTVTDFVDFTGQTNSIQPTNIIPRVTGYVTEIHFKEGQEVKEKDLLFVIDPRPYDAQFEQQKSQVKLSDASLDLAKKTLARFEALKKTSPGSVSEQELDQYKATVQEADARLNAQNKSLDLYKMNKEFTQVISPVDGQAGRYMATKGNLVNQDQTLLTTVQTLDPMFVDFYMDERTRETIINKIREGKIQFPAGGAMTVKMGLENETGYPHEAVLTFMNNQINPTTGSILMRARFPNPKLPAAEKPAGTGGSGPGSQGAPNTPSTVTSPAPNAEATKTSQPTATGGTGAVGRPSPNASPGAPGAPKADPAAAFIAMSTVRFDRQFAPGMFVRVRLPMGEQHPALLVIDRIIQSDQGNKYVLVVDSDGIVQQRNIKTGALQENGLRVIEPFKDNVGLKDDDWVVTGAIQQIKRGMKVTKEPRPMPTLSEPSPSPPAKAAPAKSGQAKSGQAKAGPEQTARRRLGATDPADHEYMPPATR